MMPSWGVLSALVTWSLTATDEFERTHARVTFAMETTVFRVQYVRRYTKFGKNIARVGHVRLPLVVSPGIFRQNGAKLGQF